MLNLKPGQFSECTTFSSFCDTLKMKWIRKESQQLSIVAGFPHMNSKKKEKKRGAMLCLPGSSPPQRLRPPGHCYPASNMSHSHDESSTGCQLTRPQMAGSLSHAITALIFHELRPVSTYVSWWESKQPAIMVERHWESSTDWALSSHVGRWGMEGKDAGQMVQN